MSHFLGTSAAFDELDRLLAAKFRWVSRNNTVGFSCRGCGALLSGCTAGEDSFDGLYFYDRDKRGTWARSSTWTPAPHECLHSLVYSVVHE